MTSHNLDFLTPFPYPPVTKMAVLLMLLYTVTQKCVPLLHYLHDVTHQEVGEGGKHLHVALYKDETVFMCGMNE